MFLVSPCCVHRDRRPDQNSKRRPHTPFCFVHFLKVFVWFLLFVPRHGSRRLLSRPSPLQVGVGARRDRRESGGRESLKSAAIRGTLKPAVCREITAVIRGSKVKFAGCRSPARHPRLTQAHRPRGKQRRRSLLTQARRPRGNRRWLQPWARSSGSSSPVSARSAIHRSRGSSSIVPARSAVLSLVVPTGTVLINLVLSVMSMETRLGQVAPRL